MKEILEILEEPDEDDVDEELDATCNVMLGQMRTLVMKVEAR